MGHSAAPAHHTTVGLLVLGWIPWPEFLDFQLKLSKESWIPLGCIDLKKGLYRGKVFYHILCDLNSPLSQPGEIARALDTILDR